MRRLVKDISRLLSYACDLPDKQAYDKLLRIIPNIYKNYGKYKEIDKVFARYDGADISIYDVFAYDLVYALIKIQRRKLCQEKNK